MLRTTYAPLLGTTIKVAIDTSPWRSDRRATEKVVNEIKRLSDVFNVFAPLSAISQLAQSGSTQVPELLQLIELAKQWQTQSSGRLDTKIGTSEINLNAIAKGWIVDRAAESCGKTRSLLIEAGGDVLFRGKGSVHVSIQNPLRPYDNELPVMVVNLSNGALATSGGSHRDGHLVDPRTGKTPAAIASASVVALDAATADVVATICAVGGITDGLELGQKLGLAVGLVGSNGQLHRNEEWLAIEVQSR